MHLDARLPSVMAFVATLAARGDVCKGQGGRQKGVFDRYGQPCLNKNGKPQIRPLRPVHGWRSGDVAVFEGKNYRVTPRATGRFELRAPGGKPFGKPMKYLAPIHRQDGYEYA